MDVTGSQEWSCYTTKPFTDSMQSQAKFPPHSLQKWDKKENYSKFHMEPQKTLDS